MSRADLARKMGLTRQTLSNIADELFAEGLITEKLSTDKRCGRTPSLLELKSDAYYAIGVYISRAGCQVGLVNIKGKVVELGTIDRAPGNRAELLSDVVRTAERFLTLPHIPHNRILGIGVSAPGPVDKRAGVILNPPGLENWHNADIVTPFQETLQLNTIVENNTSSLADFERHYGNGKGRDNFILLLVDSGIGCGIITDGKPYHGAHLLSGEIGHTSINYFGDRCSCGNTGCLELYAAIPNLLTHFGFEKNQWETVVRRARNGDKNVLHMLTCEVDYLTAGIINAVNLLDTEAVILDGDIVEVFDLIQPYMEEQINNKIITRSFGRVKLLPSCRLPNHHVAAAANIVFSDCFSGNGKIEL